MFRWCSAPLFFPGFRKLLRAGEWKDVPPGTLLANEGTEVDMVYVIAKGKCSVTGRPARPGQIPAAHDVLLTLGAGNLVGEMSVVLGSDPGANISTFSIIATEPTRVYQWKPNTIRSVCVACGGGVE